MADIRIKSLTTKAIEDGSYFAHDLTSADETGKVTAAAIATYVAADAGITGLDSITDATIPLKDGTDFADSSITESATEVVSSKSIAVTEAGSATIGTLKISSAGIEPCFSNSANSTEAFGAYYAYDTSTGTTNPGYRKATAGEVTIVDYTGADETKSVDFSFYLTESQDSLITKFQINVATELSNALVVVRHGSAAGAELARNSAATVAVGAVTYSLSNKFFLADNEVVHVTVSFDSGSITGTTIVDGTYGSQFIPQMKTYGYAVVKTDLVDEDSYTNSTIKTMYEANADTNAYTDDEKTKLGALPINSSLETSLASSIHKATDAEISAITLKSDVDPSDVLLIEDSEDSYSKKRVVASSLPVVSLINSANTESISVDSNGFPVLSSEIAQFIPKFEVHSSPFLLGLTELPTSDQTFVLRYRSDFDETHTINLIVDSTTVHTEEIAATSVVDEIEFEISDTVWGTVSGSFEFSVTLDSVLVHKEFVDVAASVNTLLTQKAHGGGYFETGLDTTCTALDTFYKMTPSTCTEWSSYEVEFNSTSKRIIYNGVSEDLRVSIDFTCTASEAGTITYALYKNGSAVAGIKRQKAFNGSVPVIPFSMSGIVSAVTDDYFEVYISSSVSGMVATTADLQFTVG